MVTLKHASFQTTWSVLVTIRKHDSIALNTAVAVLKPLVGVQKGGGLRPWLRGAAPSLALGSFCEIQSFTLLTQNQKATVLNTTYIYALPFLLCT